MVTVTLSTLENSLPLYIRSLLTENLVDPRSSRVNPFVFKDPPEKENDEYPYIIIEPEASDSIFPTDGSLMIPREIDISIRVLSKGEHSIKYRDQLTDSITEIFQDITNEDEDGVSIRQCCMNTRAIRSDNTSIFKQDGHAIRIKEITVTVVYYGA